MDKTIYYIIAGVSFLGFATLTGYMLYYVFRFGYAGREIKYVISAISVIATILFVLSFVFLMFM